MGIVELTSYDVRCDICDKKLFENWRTQEWDRGDLLPGPHGAFKSQLEAHHAAIKAGWSDDTTATKCPDCKGVVTRKEPWWDSFE